MKKESMAALGYAMQQICDVKWWGTFAGIRKGCIYPHQLEFAIEMMAADWKSETFQGTIRFFLPEWFRTLTIGEKLAAVRRYYKQAKKEMQT